MVRRFLAFVRPSAIGYRLSAIGQRPSGLGCQPTGSRQPAADSCPGSFWIVAGLLLCFLSWSGSAAASGPAPTREEVLRLVPPDLGLCLVLGNLPDHVDKCLQTRWFKELQESPLGKALAASPEAAQLRKMQDDLPRLLGLDWARLRDDIFGDVIVLAHRAGPPERPDDEEGLLLLRARKAEVLAQLVDRWNKGQKKAGELLELTELTHQGARYFRRGERQKKNYYWLHGPLLVFANKEEMIRKVIDRQATASQEPCLLGKQLRQAGVEQALAALWINPRAVEPELRHKAKSSREPEATALGALLRYWQALDAVVLGLTAEEVVEVRLTLLARSSDLPAPAQRLLRAAAQPSELWQRFPPQAMVRLVGRIDAVALAEVIGEFSPAPVRQQVTDTVQRALGAALGLDLAKELLPQLGPDWGLCVAPAPDPRDFPHLLAALAVRPGNAAAPVDQTLVRAIQFLAGLVLFDYNRKNPNPIRLKTLKQDNVEIKYLEGDKVFPPGCQPALALKEGCLVLASSPEAIRRFRAGAVTVPPPLDAPFLHLSLSEMARWLRGRRPQVVDFLAEKNQLTKAQAAQNLDILLAVFDLVDQVSLGHSPGEGQLTWTLRLGKNDAHK